MWIVVRQVFFVDTAGVLDIIRFEGGSPSAEVEFIYGDYSTDLGIESESFDVLVSLYAGFVSEARTDYLQVGGVLPAAPSHGDAAIASIDPRYELSGAVTSRSGDYRVRTDALDTYLAPKAETTITRKLLHKRRKGIPCTKSPFAYLFTPRKLTAHNRHLRSHQMTFRDAGMSEGFRTRSICDGVGVIGAPSCRRWATGGGRWVEVSSGPEMDAPVSWSKFCGTIDMVRGIECPYRPSPCATNARGRLWRRRSSNAETGSYRNV